MARRYLLQPLEESPAYTLPRDLGHHLCSVMRLRMGSTLRLFDGKGSEADAQVTACRRDQVEVAIGRLEQIDREPSLRLSVAFPVPRAARCDWLLEHGCELGIRHFFPITVNRSRPARPDGRSNRWRRILCAAAGQCDRSQLPELHPTQTLEQLLRHADQLPACRIFADADAPALTATAARDAIFIVGPEGGFTDSERETLCGTGFLPRSLGPLTLRTETALLVGAARLLQET